MVAVLVINYHQPLEQAWGFTLREYILVADFKREVRLRTGGGWDDDKVDGMVDHLRSMGVQGV